MRRIATLFPFAIAAVLAACASAAGRGEAADGPSGPAGAPFALRLSFTAGTLTCRISNTSATAQAYPYDRLCHPSRLRLFRGGAELASFDRRSVMKFDYRLRTSHLRTLAPGAAATLDEGAARRGGDGLELGWGPHRFHQLAPGDYEAEVAFRIEYRGMWDDEAATWIPCRYWTNERPLVSNRVRLRL